MSSLPSTDKLARRCHCIKVLVAEDHDDTRFLLRLLLEQRGLAVVEASDGEAACEMAERESPDLILMDGGLPLLDGISATRRMRGLTSLARVPIVFLSGHAGPHHQRAALDAGCDEYIVKPFEIVRLDDILNRLLPAQVGPKTRAINQTHMTQSALSSEARREGRLTSPEGTHRQKLFGLFELDAAGTVLYARFEGETASSFSARDATGRNFYTEVATFENVEEFRLLLDSFSRGSVGAHSIDFICLYEDEPLPVRVLLTRIRERAERDMTKSILIHIRRAQQ